MITGDFAEQQIKKSSGGINKIAGCVGTKTPQLEFTPKAASGLIITHKGGDSIALKEVKITVRRETDNKIIDGLNAVSLYGNTPEFQEAPAIETLGSGQKIRMCLQGRLSQRSEQQLHNLN